MDEKIICIATPGPGRGFTMSKYGVLCQYSDLFTNKFSPPEYTLNLQFGDGCYPVLETTPQETCLTVTVPHEKKTLTIDFIDDANRRINQELVQKLGLDLNQIGLGNKLTKGAFSELTTLTSWSHDRATIQDLRDDLAAARVEIKRVEKKYQQLKLDYLELQLEKIERESRIREHPLKPGSMRLLILEEND